ncbi:hypothetical protein NO995_11020 [Aestuariibaculum sp. M13]|uniref:DUF6602 domain-containing protein n=1 Tax=Aestuariibaculum sp. M13 TaxID=2967132 RepID=UPI002159D6E6|nr:DUF6602 domain-containing protein [Aestuariibaculum sp. M13]MCR8668217.1 hypothetical protein [Aestuariibaculum sp. M13]
MSEKVDLRGLFNGLQSQMISEMKTNREFIEHSTTKGDAFEDIWIDYLKTYLPSRYCVDKAIIIDSKGNKSMQIDLVIYDQTYTPFVFIQKNTKYIPAEGVYAVFEVKPDLNKNYILYAGDKIESVRKLFRTSASIIDRGQKRDPISLTKILGGVLSFESKIKKDDTIKKHLKSLKGLKSLDIGCAVNYKSFYVDYIKDDSILKSKADSAEIYNKQFLEFYNDRTFDTIEFSYKYNSLVTFFLQLSRYLQQSIGTVAAIDLSEYAKAINFEIDQEI